ncbi:MAG: DUF3253 domain-containing protein [Erythrobacter sp.]|uniref:DUF3253 domain-containing protein n=1 Tax=Erythrobacter sp. TaxID=1042 RepID=UPI003C73D707
MTAKAKDAILRLIKERGPAKSICPSEAARAVATEANDWRDCMPDVHEAVRTLHAQGLITVTVRGEPIDPGREGGPRGPYRIAQPRPVS